MSSIPQGSYAVRQVHTNIGKHQAWDIALNKIQGYEKLSAKQMFQVNTLDMDHPLAKYNSKLMKSIWGMYNRYSVHNLKSVAEGENTRFTGGQPLTINYCHLRVSRHAAASPASSGSSPKGGTKKNGSLSNPIWEALQNGHTY